MALTSGLLLALALCLARPPGRFVLLARFPGRTGRGLPAWRPRLPPPPVLLAVPVAAWLTGVALPHVLVAVTVSATAVVVVRLHRAGRRRARAATTRREVAEAMDVLAAQVRAGLAPATAVRAAAEDLPWLGGVAGVAAVGGDVPAALRTSAARPGAAALGSLAAAWAVAERSGAPLAEVLERLGDGVRADLEVHREVESAVAPARATSRLLAGLPVLGLGLGGSLGSDPVHVLLHTLPGALCLVAGVGLSLLGLLWVDHLVEGAQP
ncbi:type II secretion system F family protein [Aeromicrobium massiliense]|uniref:type II secretion system F family protein n=1 Tax=Aeromicrobium massiliense TaxID=1464554 RepID=UPI00067646EE|nr:type II secretion system F family protein [Aeromicrobium massiliense]